MATGAVGTSSEIVNAAGDDVRIAEVGGICAEVHGSPADDLLPEIGAGTTTRNLPRQSVFRFPKGGKQLFLSFATFSFDLRATIVELSLNRIRSRDARQRRS